jgi:hypothetical protein
MKEHRYERVMKWPTRKFGARDPSPCLQKPKTKRRVIVDIQGVIIFIQ